MTMDDSAEIARLLRDCEVYQACMACRTSAEIDYILDQMDPTWRDVTVTADQEQDALNSWSAVLIQSAFRRALVRIAVSRDIYWSRYAPIVPPPPPLIRHWASQ